MFLNSAVHIKCARKRHSKFTVLLFSDDYFDTFSTYEYSVTEINENSCSSV